MAKKSRTKGASYEREVAEAMRTVWPGAKRGIGQARSGSEVPDVDGTPFWVECKRRARIPFTKWMKQADLAATVHGNAKTPALVLREDAGKSYVVVDLDTFLRLCAQVWQ